MENDLKNDFTGTWICRNGKETIIHANPEEYTKDKFPFMGDNLVIYDLNGYAQISHDWDLMERISEKDHRR